MALAALVAFMPGGEALSRTVVLVISLGFLAGMAFLASRLYREQSLMLAGLSDRRRAALYGAVGLIALLISGYQAFADFEGRLLLWLILLLASAGVIFFIIRNANRYD